MGLPRRQTERGSGAGQVLIGAAYLAFLHRGDCGQAQRQAVAALTLRRKIGDRIGIAEVLNGLGTFTLWQGDYQQATSRYEECLVLKRELGEPGRSRVP